MSTGSILSILAYPQYGYHLVCHMGLSLVHCSYLSVGSLQLAESVWRLSLLETAIAQALSSRGQTLAAVNGLGKSRERRKVSKEQRTGASSGHLAPQLAPLLPIFWRVPSQ